MLGAKLKIHFVGGVNDAHTVDVEPVNLPISQATADMLKGDLAIFLQEKHVNDVTTAEIDEKVNLPIPLNLGFAHFNLNVRLNAGLVFEIDDDPNAPPAADPVIAITSAVDAPAPEAGS